MMSVMLEDVAKCGDNIWYVDSGASSHMANHSEWKYFQKPKKQKS